MTAFVDQTLMQLSDPANLVELLTPAGDTDHTRLRTLLNAMYDIPYATIHNIPEDEIVIRKIEAQRPLFPPGSTRGTWTQTVPNHNRTDVVYESSNGLDPVWLDISAEIRLVLELTADLGEVESISTRPITDFETLDEFRAHFRFFDLDKFMKQHDITTVEELQERFHYLLTEIKLAEPDDSVSQRAYTLNLAIFIRDDIDVRAALQDIKLAQAALERTLTYHRETDAAEVRTPYAPLIIFSRDALNGFSEDSVQNFFAKEQILALFLTSA